MLLPRIMLVKMFFLNQTSLYPLNLPILNCQSPVRANLLQAIEWDEFSKDEILDRFNNLKRQRLEGETKLNHLLKTRDNLTSLADAKIKFGKLYEQVLDHLQNANTELKTLALDALDIRVYASTKRIEIQGIMPLELPASNLPTTGQTSGCLIVNDYNSSTGKETVSIIPG
ncbi:hypothetical protein ACFLVX_02325 [Chloroflexota bacterium]